MASTDAKAETPHTADPRPRCRATRSNPSPRSANPCWTGWPGPAAASRCTPWSSSTSPRPAARIEDADPRVSWTGFVIATVARAVAAAPRGERPQGRQPDPLLRPGRHRRDRGTPLAGPHRAGHRGGHRAPTDQSCAEITEVLHRAKYGPGQPHRPRGLTAAARAPARAAAARPPSAWPGPDQASPRPSGRPSASRRSGCSPAAGAGPSRSHRSRSSSPSAASSTARGPRRARRRQADAAAHPELRPRRHRRRARRPLHRDAAHPGRVGRGVRRHALTSASEPRPMPPCEQHHD